MNGWVDNKITLNVAAARLGGVILLLIAIFVAWLTSVAQVRDPLWHAIILGIVAFSMLVGGIVLVTYKREKDYERDADMR